MKWNMTVKGNEPTITVPARIFIRTEGSSWDTVDVCYGCGASESLPSAKNVLKHKPGCPVRAALAGAELSAMRET